MATTITYILRNLASDLSGGADFSLKLLTATGISSNASITVAISSTETSYAWTEPGIPGVDGKGGDYSVEINVTTSNTSIFGSIQLHRVDSSGTVQTSSSTTSEQQFSATGVLTFSLSSVDLGTWASGDRLRVDYIFRNASAMANQTFGIQRNTTSCEVVTPWGACRKVNLKGVLNTLVGGIRA